MEILIKNVKILTMDNDIVYENGYVGVDRGKIVYLSDKEPDIMPLQYIDGTNCLVMPGLHNIHTHVPMTAMRGFADDYNLQEWLNDYVFPTEARHDEKTIYYSTLLGIADSIRHGTVSIKDMYFTLNQVGKAVYESGIKANISYGATSFDMLGYDFNKEKSTIESKDFLATWHNADNGRIRLETSIHGEYTSFDKVWAKNAEFARENNLNMHVHISETLLEHDNCKAKYNYTPTQILDKYGVWETRSTAAHCVFSERCDWEIFKNKNVTVAHNAVSNLKLGSGIAPISNMLESGVRVGLGTDSVCSNNSHDMFEEMKTAALLQKGYFRNPTLVNSREAVKMATINGAFAQNRENESGKLKLNFDADIIMIALNKPNLMPIHDIYSAIVYSMRGLDVKMNMVSGKILYKDGEFKTIDIEKLLFEIENYVYPKLFKK